MATGPPVQPIVLYDGSCGFCNGAVEFIRQHAPTGEFRYLARQSPEGAALLARHGVDPRLTSSMVLLERGGAYIRSDAALLIARHFQSPWNALAAFHIVPRGIRDQVYGFISRNRHRWSRGPEVCSVPSPDLPIACTLQTPELRERERTLLAALRTHIVRTEGLPDGYSLWLDDSDEAIAAAAAVIRRSGSAARFWVSS